MPQNLAKLENRIRENLRFSAIAGPSQVIISAGVYFVLYPVLIRYASLEVIGLWTLIASIASQLRLADCGFSTLFTRRLSEEKHLSLADLAQDWSATIAFYQSVTFVAGFVAIWVLWLWGDELISSELSTTSMLVVALLVLFGTYLQLYAQLQNSILSGFHRTFVSDVVGIGLPLVRLGIAVSATIAGFPLEGLAAGLAAEGIIRCSLLKFWTKNAIAEWQGNIDNQQRMPVRETVGRVINLARDGKDLYLVNLGFAVRDPVFRTIIAISTGLESVAIYDMALRIPLLAKTTIMSASRALFPTITYLLGESKKDLQKALLKITTILVWVSVLVCGVYLLSSNELLTLWIGPLSMSVVEPSNLLCIWVCMTIMNVPYWYLLQSAHCERLAGATLWIHTGLVIALYPISQLYEFDLRQILVYWLVTSAITQFAIYWVVESRLGLFRNTALTWQNLCTALFALAAFKITGDLPSRFNFAPGSGAAIYGLLVGLLGYVMIIRRGALRFELTQPSTCV